LTLNPTDPKPLGPNEDEEVPTGSSDEERQAIRGVKALLEVTQNLKQHSKDLNSPEYSQKILLRGELIQALGELQLLQFSADAKSYLLKVLNQIQEIAPEVDQSLNKHKTRIAESLKNLKNGKKVQKGYYSATETRTREFEG
jgi:hypothetical protein